MVLTADVCLLRWMSTWVTEFHCSDHGRRSTTRSTKRKRRKYYNTRTLNGTSLHMAFPWVIMGSDENPDVPSQQSNSIHLQNSNKFTSFIHTPNYRCNAAHITPFLAANANALVYNTRGVIYTGSYHYAPIFFVLSRRSNGWARVASINLGKVIRFFCLLRLLGVICL